MATVYLVGAGPGDGGLLTLKGKEILEKAQVVLYDRLVSLSVLAHCPSSALMINVGKEAHHHPVPQEEINRLLLHHAKDGKIVVRLKGGDPFVFGRGGEELEGVVEEGIDFQVVPGVTSALGVPAYGGVPVTHREYSSSVHIVTPQGKNHTKVNLPYKELAKLKGTLVFLMGVGALEETAQKLILEGLSPHTPAVLIQEGSTSRQRELFSTLGELPAKAVAENFQPPCVFLVGEVGALGAKYHWREKRPLSQATTLLVQPPQSGSRLEALLKEEGGQVVSLPSIERKILPFSQEVTALLPTLDWLVFTSPTGVEAFFSGLCKAQKDSRCLGGVKIASVGPATTKALNKHGLLVDLQPKVYNGNALGDALKKEVGAGDRVLLYRSSKGRGYLYDRLKESTKTVWDVPAYHTLSKGGVLPYLRPRLQEGEVDYIAFTSASTVEGFAALTGKMDYSSLTCMCIGPQTAKVAKEYGFQVRVSREATLESMVEGIIEAERTKKHESATQTFTRK